MKEISLYVMTVLYIAAGVNHFLNPRFYLRIIPPQLPYHDGINKISGICEVVFALLLLPMATRHIAAWLIIVLLVAIFPANICMAIKWQRKHHPKLWIAYARLPLQLVLIWWALSLM